MFAAIFVAILSVTAISVPDAGAASPAVTIKAASSVSYTSAVAKGTVNPADHETTARFQYVTDAQFKSGAWSEAEAAGETAFAAGSGQQPIEANLTSLKPGTTYHLRLIAQNDQGQSTEAVAATFTTKVVTKPSAVLESVSGVMSSAVTVGGRVNPNAPGPAPQDPAFDTRWSVECTPECSTVPSGEILADNVNHSVGGQISGLEPNTKYVVRLVAENAGGQTKSGTKTFTTGKSRPAILNSITQVVSGGTAEFAAEIDTENDNTTYFFEYGRTAAYGQTTASAGPIRSPRRQKVVAIVQGLSTGTSYHWRVVAVNASGPSFGPDQIITTAQQSELTESCANQSFRYGFGFNLPDCRAYEQVSPVQKNGASVRGGKRYTQAATGSENVFSFYSQTPLPGSEGAQGFQVYMSRRGPAGWSTTGLFPPAPGGAQASILGWSEDMSQSYVTQSAGAVREGTLYLRDQNAALRPIVSPFIATAAQRLDSLAGTSSDDNVVLFDARDALLPQAVPNAFNSYVWDKATGELHVAGALNEREGIPGRAPEEGASSGGFDSAEYLEYSLAAHPLSADGSLAFFSSHENHQIYVRQNPTRPQSGMSGGLCLIPSNACTYEVSASDDGTVDPLGPQPATFQGATPNGEYAFLTSAEKLTGTSTTGPGDEGVDLYRYDSSTHDLVDITASAESATEPAGAEVQGVLGFGDDGQIVYFIANGVLAPGAVPGNCASNLFPGESLDESVASGFCNLYAARIGAFGPEVKFIAPMNFSYRPLGEKSEQRATDAANILLGPPGVGVSDGKTSRVSGDGNILLFRSQERLGSYANTGVPEFYRYVFGAQPQCVSCNPTGAAPTGTPTLTDALSEEELNIGNVVLSRNLVDGGNRIFFESPDALVPADTNGGAGCSSQANSYSWVPSCQDVYEWESEGTGSCPGNARNGGCLSLISTGTDPDASYFGDSDPSGDNVYFSTSQSLVRQDQDQLRDVYDARVLGGLSAQAEGPPPVRCLSSEECRDASESSPSPETPATTTFVGPGNGKKHHIRRKKHHRRHRHHRGKNARRHRNHDRSRGAHRNRSGRPNANLKQGATR